jgi:hypothetical protein
MDSVREHFLATSRRHFATRPAPAAPSVRVRTRMLKREANQFPQSAAVRAAINLLRRCSI